MDITVIYQLDFFYVDRSVVVSTYGVMGHQINPSWLTN